MLHSCMLGPISWLPVDRTCLKFQNVIRGSYSYFWCTYHDPSTQASVHACFILVCFGLYLGYLLMELAQIFRTWSGNHIAYFVAHIQAHKLLGMHASLLHASALNKIYCPFIGITFFNLNFQIIVNTIFSLIFWQIKNNKAMILENYISALSLQILFKLSWSAIEIYLDYLMTNQSLSGLLSFLLYSNLLITWLLSFLRVTLYDLWSCLLNALIFFVWSGYFFISMELQILSVSLCRTNSLN